MTDLSKLVRKTGEPTPIINPPQPCKPRAYSTQADKLPMVYRTGALDFRDCPSVVNGRPVPWKVSC